MKKQLRYGFASKLGFAPNQVQDFYNDNWARKIALSHPDFYQWQFMAPPSHKGDDLCVLATEGDSILGVMGLTARTFQLVGRQLRGAELTTWVVAPEAQGKGIGQGLLRFIQAEFDVAIGMGISKMAVPLYRLAGFNYLAAIPRFLKITDLAQAKKIGVFDRLSEKLISQIASNSLRYEVEEIDLGALADSEGMLPADCNGFSRSAIDLNWRYALHPFFIYRGFRIVVGEDVAIVILREEAQPDVRVVHILDVLGDTAAFNAAIAYVEDHARSGGFYFVDFFCVASEVFRYFLARGWFSILDDAFPQMPHLFHPLELRDPPTTSLVYWSKQEFSDLCNLGKLYITKEDTDLDRPTGATIEAIQS